MPVSLSESRKRRCALEKNMNTTAPLEQSDLDAFEKSVKKVQTFKIIISRL
jgi:hypothetical protein